MNAPERTKVIIHADAGPLEGWGHLRESLEIAKALRTRGADCLLVVPSGSPQASVEAEAEGFDVVKIPAKDWQSGGPPDTLQRLIEAIDASFLVCDLVRVGARYTDSIGSVCSSWAVVTELVEDEVGAINFNIGQSPEYMPLDDAYQNAGRRATRPSIQRVLISYGGSDPRNITTATLEMLRPAIGPSGPLHGVEIVVILGPLFEHTDAVQTVAASYPATVDIVGPLTAAEMALTVAGSDIAITTAGGTMYEFCALGLPSLVVPIVEKHDTNARVLEKRGIVVRANMHDQLTAEEIKDAVVRLAPEQTRAAMSAAAQREIDGKGAARIASRLCDEWGIG